MKPYFSLLILEKSLSVGDYYLKESESRIVGD